MNEPEKTNPAIARLVLFMVCLAIFGSIVAGAHYYAVDLPEQKSIKAPENAGNNLIVCQLCKKNCIGKADYYGCLDGCSLVC
jgi:hypothetical protein